MWSVRLSKGLEVLGHDVTVERAPVDGTFDVVIVNLGEPNVDWPARVAHLQARGIKVIAHAGHKEKEVIALGREAGCDVVATNSELTNKLADVLARVSA